MNNIDDVKQPCPFCGGYDMLSVSDDESYTERLNDAEREINDRIASISIRCIRCHARLSIVSGEPYAIAQAQLVEKWNKRWKE